MSDGCRISGRAAQARFLASGCRPSHFLALESEGVVMVSLCFLISMYFPAIFRLPGRFIVVRVSITSRFMAKALSLQCRKFLIRKKVTDLKQVPVYT